MTPLIIAILIAFGFIGSPSDFHNLSTQEQADLTSIVIDDLEGI